MFSDSQSVILIGKLGRPKFGQNPQDFPIWTLQICKSWSRQDPVGSRISKFWPQDLQIWRARNDGLDDHGIIPNKVNSKTLTRTNKSKFVKSKKLFRNLCTAYLFNISIQI